MPGADPLLSFHPLVREWFLSRYGSPTAVQAASWPRIAAGEHVLALAPTGSGKTLAAFLGAISRLASGDLPVDRCSVLYVSPLKALGEDLRRNLEGPLAELAGLFRERGVAFPPIRAATRSGDTSQADRRRMLARPPSILVTTPESLALMLDAPSSRRLLEGVRLLVLDEIHAVAGDKRGALLACAVGRLALLAGEFQRLALSATVRPPEAIAEFVGALELSRAPDGTAVYRPRPVAIVDPPSEKRIELSVEWPPAAALGAPSPPGTADAKAADGTRYAALAPAIAARARAVRSLLVFTDSRRRAERLAFLVNESAGETLAWAHHGSLSRESRRAVEARLKAGELPCVVATASLELGIDVGSVEEVILAGAPAALSSALQRVGRSGHGVGQASRGRLFPFHGMDLLLAAAVARGVGERAVEAIRPVRGPLDILAQVLLSLAVDGPRTIDALYDIIRSFPPFVGLSRQLFDATVEMLAGRYSEVRVRELEPRISLDRATMTVSAKDSVRPLLYSSGGAIPDRGLYSMRLSGSRTKIGELDEEFVWERKPGDAFSFGVQSWRIVAIGSEAVEVVPLGRDADFMPFWRADSRYRSPELVVRSLELLDRLGSLGAGEGATLLEAELGFDGPAAAALARFVAAQAAAGGGARSLPGLRRVVIEANEDPARRGDALRLVFHTLRGGAVNEPLSLALAAVWEEATGLPAQTLSDDDSILLIAPRIEGGEEPLELATQLLRSLGERGRMEALVRSRLESTGLFGAQFRENAARALLLPRGLPGKRIPLWVTRLRAKKLFEAVRSYADFPVVVETWRSCLCDLLDVEGAANLASGIARGEIELVAFASRAPSPFAREAVWKETNEFLYRGDAIEAKASSSVSDRVIEEALRSARLRPRIAAEAASDFERRLKRLLPGWGPDDGAALAEWAKERVLIPASELPGILAASGPSLAASLEADPSCGGRLERLVLAGATEELLVHAERSRALEEDPAAHVAEWLRREACVPIGRITSLFGIPAGEAADLVDALEEEGTIVAGALIDGVEERLVADAQNLEILLRRMRKAARPSVEARPREDLFRLVAAVQGLRPVRGGASGDPRGERPGAARARAVLESLEGYPLPAALWESEVLPARLGAAERDIARVLDDSIESGEWQWFGAGKESIALSRVEDLELFLESNPDARRRPSRLVPEDAEGLEFWAIRNRAGRSSRATAMALWAEAWGGLVAADSFSPLREGLANRFGKDLPEAAEGATVVQGAVQLPFGAPRRVPRALRERWRTGAPMGGRWFRLDLEEEGERDQLDLDDLDAARARTLVARYGLVCRELLERELSALRWGRVFTALRRLELSGELLAGSFFEGLDGPQFMGTEAFALFQKLEGSIDEMPLWLNALDPAASAIAARNGALAAPQRVAASRICVSGGRIVAASTRSYKELALALDPADPFLPGVLSLFKNARERIASPERRIILELVNGLPASRSPYTGALEDAGFEADRGRMMLW